MSLLSLTQDHLPPPFLCGSHGHCLHLPLCGFCCFSLEPKCCVDVSRSVLTPAAEGLNLHRVSFLKPFFLVSVHPQIASPTAVLPFHSCCHTPARALSQALPVSRGHPGGFVFLASCALTGSCVCHLGWLPSILGPVNSAMSPFLIGPPMFVPTKTLPHSAVISSVPFLLSSDQSLVLFSLTTSLSYQDWTSYIPEAGLEFPMEPSDLELPISLPSAKITSVNRGPL